MKGGEGKARSIGIFSQPLRRCKRAGCGLLQCSGGLRLVGGGEAGLNALIDFFAMHRNVFRGVDADPDLLAANAQIQTVQMSVLLID